MADSSEGMPKSGWTERPLNYWGNPAEVAFFYITSVRRSKEPRPRYVLVVLRRIIFEGQGVL